MAYPIMSFNTMPYHNYVVTYHTMLRICYHLSCITIQLHYTILYHVSHHPSKRFESTARIMFKSLDAMVTSKQVRLTHRGVGESQPPLVLPQWEPGDSAMPRSMWIAWVANHVVSSVVLLYFGYYHDVICIYHDCYIIYMCICMCVYIYIYIYIIHISLSLSIYLSIYLSLYIHIYIYIYTYMYICIYAYRFVCMYVCMYACMHVCMH